MCYCIVLGSLGSLSAESLGHRTPFALYRERSLRSDLFVLQRGSEKVFRVTLGDGRLWMVLDPNDVRVLRSVQCCLPAKRASVPETWAVLRFEQLKLKNRPKVPIFRIIVTKPKIQKFSLRHLGVG